MQKRNITILTIIVLYFSFQGISNSLEFQKFFNFDAENGLKEWTEKVFKNKVFYVIEPRQEDGYLSAESKESCSGLFYKIRFNPNEYPMISWEWKVLTFPNKSKETTISKGWIEKDDYPARVYVIFPSIFFKNTKCIEYVWDENLPEETKITSPYLENIKIIVVESGKTNINKWVIEERNISEDYKMLFGTSAPYVGAIAIMTDADNTLSTAEAMYNNIKVGYINE